MIVVLVLIILALGLTLGVYQVVRGFAADVSAPEQLIGRTEPIDLLAFRNLVDPAEDEFLRAHLPRHSLYRVRSARSRAAIDYVQMVAHNAALLIRLGQAAQNSSKAQVRKAGAELVALGIKTRILTGIALVQLGVSFVLPFWVPSLLSLGQTYTNLRATLSSVVSWQRPEMAGIINEAV